MLAQHCKESKAPQFPMGMVYCERPHSLLTPPTGNWADHSFLTEQLLYYKEAAAERNKRRLGIQEKNPNWQDKEAAHRQNWCFHALSPVPVPSSALFHIPHGPFQILPPCRTTRCLQDCRPQRREPTEHYEPKPSTQWLHLGGHQCAGRAHASD